MNDSILNSIKRMLDIDRDNNDFDDNIIILINKAISDLRIIGFSTDLITIDINTNYNDLIPYNLQPILGYIQNYLYLSVKISFDNITNSKYMDILNELKKEIEWKIYILVDNGGDNVTI